MSSIYTKNEYDQLCRTCLQENSSLCYIHDVVKISQVEVSLAQAISLCTSVDVHIDDKLPQYLCEICRDAIFGCYEFRILCERSDKILKMRRLQEQNINASGTDLSKLLLENTDVDLLTDSNQFDEKESLTTEIIDLNKEYDVTHPIYRELKKDAAQNTVEVTSSEIMPISNKVISSPEKEHHEEHTAVIRKDDHGITRNTCEECGKVFQNRTYMLRHKKRHASLPMCLYCEYVTTIPLKLAEHMEEEHVDKKNIECKICGKKFFKKGNLLKHELVHSGVKNHTCEVCGQSFALKGNLNAHMRIHTGEKPYTCSKCGKGFAQHSTLRSHEICHSERKEYVCSECGVAFGRLATLTKHKKRHLSNRPFACSQCKKTFGFKNDLTTHARTHTGVKNHVCEVCDKRFNRNSSLHVHRRIHTGETPHVCDVCGRGFNQKHVLRTHLKTHNRD